MQAPIIEDEIEEDDPSFQFSDDEQARCRSSPGLPLHTASTLIAGFIMSLSVTLNAQEAEFHRQMATRTVMPVDMAGPRGGIGQSPQHGAPSWQRSGRWRQARPGRRLHGQALRHYERSRRSPKPFARPSLGRQACISWREHERHGAIPCTVGPTSRSSSSAGTRRRSSCHLATVPR